MNLLFTGAEDEARRAGEAEPGAEHLVLAALELPDGSARRAFENVGADPDEFRVALGAQHIDALGSAGIEAPEEVFADRLPEPSQPTGVYRSKGSAHKMFKKVVKMVKKERSQLYGAYFVLVASESDLGTTARTLAAMDVDRTQLMAAARAELDTLNA